MTGMRSSSSKALKLYAAIGLLVFSELLVLSIVPPVSAAKTFGCGSTITASTTLSADIGPCGNNGITIGVGGITLNCAGHTISGTGSYKGIIIGTKRIAIAGVTVENCNVTEFEYGFVLGPGSHANILTENTASGNDYGFYLVRDYGNTLTGNTANENKVYGFYVFRSTSIYSGQNSLSGNTANGNGKDGFYLDSTSKNTIITGNTANSNTAYGYFDASASGRNAYSLDECSSNLLGGSNPTGLCTPQG